MKHVFLLFVILQLFITSAAIAADPDFDTIRSHSRYVLDVDNNVSVYMYAADEKDELCEFGGGFCQTQNEHVISGNYKLFVITNADNPSIASIISSTQVGEKAFNPTSPYNIQPKIFEMPDINGKLISITEDARPALGRPFTSLFRLDDKYNISPVKFFLKDGKEFTDSGELSIENQKLVMYITDYDGVPPERAKTMPGKFDKNYTRQTIYFTYKNGNFYEADK